MEFNNLDANILFMMGGDCCRSGAVGSYDRDTLLGAFPDLPAKAIEARLRKLYENGSLSISAGGRKLSLTPKGVAKVRSLPPCRPLRPSD